MRGSLPTDAYPTDGRVAACFSLQLQRIAAPRQLRTGKFKDDELKQLRKSPEEFDADGGGNLDKEEIVLAARKSGMDDVTEDGTPALLTKKMTVRLRVTRVPS